MIGTVQVVTPQGTFCATAADLVSAGPFTAGHTLNGVSTTTAPPCPQIAFADVRITPGAANVPNGVYTLSARARDLAGNLSDPLTRTWEVDAIPPSAIENPLVTTLPLSGGQSESFSGTARDNLSIVDQLALVHYPNSLGGADVLLRYNGSQSSAPLGTFFVPAAPIAVTVPFFVRAIALQPIAGTAFTAVASNAMRAADAIALGASDPGANWTYGSIGGFALDNSAGQASPGTFFGGANQPVNASITYQANNVTTPSAGFSAGAACAAAGGDAAFTLNSASTGCATSVTINLVQNGAAGVPFQSQITNVSLYIRGATPGTPPFGGPTAYTLAGTFGGAFTGVSSATGIQTTTNSFTFVPGASGIPSFPGSAGTTAVDALVVASTANGYAIAFQLPTINLVNP
jgi:hypothetical protein